MDSELEKLQAKVERLQDRLRIITDELFEVSKQVNGVAKISEDNDKILREDITNTNRIVQDVNFAPAIMIAGVIFALEEKGLVGREQVIVHIDSIVSALLPPSSGHRAEGLAEVLYLLLRAEKDGLTGERWASFANPSSGT